MFTANAKVWHPVLGYVKYVRPLKCKEGISYVEAKRFNGVLREVKTAELAFNPPPKPTKKEKWHARFKNQLDAIKHCPSAWRVAGWMASHPTRFNMSTPPVQNELLTETFIQYGVEVEDSAVTVSTDATEGWSCHVSTEAFPFRDEFQTETGVTVSDYYKDTTRVQIQTREFVLGFLGELGFVINGEWLNRKAQDPAAYEKIYCRVPFEYLPFFKEGAE